MKASVLRAAVLAATLGLTVSCGGGTQPGDFSPSPPTATPNGTPARPYTAAWLDNKLLTAQDISGGKVIKADCRPEHVDAGGAGEYGCVVTMDNGRKYDDGYQVSSDGYATQLGPGVALN